LTDQLVSWMTHAHFRDSRTFFAVSEERQTTDSHSCSANGSET